ncbi:MAG: hypothetical protein KA715_09550 [Xanthomonadaceae bacterium]|nr:hypothetical protein [Xanthomonadaceae bacterium]
MTKQLCIISPEFQGEFLDELKHLGVTYSYETKNVIGLEQDNTEPAWAQCVWRNVKQIEIRSITDAQKKLKTISKKWRYYGDEFNRRGALIAEGIHLAKPEESSPAFTLIETNLILYSENISRPTVDGIILFVENKAIPPSRAYLKLWEALAILGESPAKGDSVLDLGASPGSWSWALAERGANVLSIDRSPLSNNLNDYKNIEFKTGDAFSFEPRKMDWLFSDVICYPDKLYQYVERWMKSGLCDKFVCTIKFAGGPDHKIIDLFRKLPHSRVVHLFNNKNEVTWISHPKI